MKILKAVAVAVFLANATSCLADNSISGLITFLALRSADATHATPFAEVNVSTASTTDPICSYLDWFLPDLTDTFQKQAYATLLTGQINGRTVSFYYKVETSSAGTTVCRITSVSLLQP